MGYVCSQNPDNILAFADIRTQSWGWFGGVLFVDLSITALMFWYLVFKPKKQSGGAVKTSTCVPLPLPLSALLVSAQELSRRTLTLFHARRPLKKVVLMAAQTNLLSAVCQIAIVILYATWPSSTYYTFFGLPEAKICASAPLSPSPRRARASRPLLPRSSRARSLTPFPPPCRLADIGSFLATLNARSPHGSGAFDDSTPSRKGFGGLSAGGGVPQQPVHVTVRQEVNIDAEDDDVSLASRKGALTGGVGGEEAAAKGSMFPARAQFAPATPSPPYRVQFDDQGAVDAEKGGRHHAF